MGTRPPRAEAPWQAGRVLGLACLLLSGLLLGGAWSLRRQRQPPVRVAVTAGLGLMALLAAVLRLVGEQQG